MATCYWPEHVGVTFIFLYWYIPVQWVAINLICWLSIARKIYVYDIVLKIPLRYHHHITAKSGNGMYVLIGITVFISASKNTYGSHYNAFSIKLLWHHLKEYVFKLFLKLCALLKGQNETKNQVVLWGECFSDDRLRSEYFRFLLSISFHKCSIPILLYIMLLAERQISDTWYLQKVRLLW
jgi:hypothetical protein